MWVFHIGSTSGLNHVISAAVGGKTLLSLGHPDSGPGDYNTAEADYPDANTDYVESFYDGSEDDFEYPPLEPTEPVPETRTGALLHPDDYNEPRRSDLEPTLLYPESSYPHPELDSVLLFPEGEEVPSVASSVSEDTRTPSSPLVYESPIEAVTAVLLGRASKEEEEDGGVHSETESSPIYPEEEVLLESFPDNAPPFGHRRRIVDVDEDVGFNPDGEFLGCHSWAQGERRCLESLPAVGG